MNGEISPFNPLQIILSLTRHACPDALRGPTILFVMLLREVMHEAHIPKIAQELSLIPKQVQATAALLNEGATVPFIARYRKEATGSLDEVAITAIRDRLNQLTEL